MRSLYLLSSYLLTFGDRIGEFFKESLMDPLELFELFELFEVEYWLLLGV